MTRPHSMSMYLAFGWCMMTPVPRSPSPPEHMPLHAHVSISISAVAALLYSDNVSLSASFSVVVNICICTCLENYFMNLFVCVLTLFRLNFFIGAEQVR